MRRVDAWSAVALACLSLIPGLARSSDDAEELSEVVVSGSYTAQSMNSVTGLTMTLRETPQTVTVITGQMIEDKGLLDMGQVLEHVPSISQVGDASGTPSSTSAASSSTALYRWMVSSPRPRT